MAIASAGWTSVTASLGTAGTTWNVTKPTGMASGHVGYLVISTNNGTAAGGSQAKCTDGTWTRLVTGEDAATANVGLSVFRRVCTGTEGTTFAFSFVQHSDDTTSQSVTAGACFFGLTGVDTTTPEDVTAPTPTANPTSGSTTQTFPATSSVTDQAWTIAFAVCDQSSGLTWTVPSGYTNLVQVATGRAAALATKGPITPAGTIASGTFGGTAAPGVGASVAVRPAGAVAARQQTLTLLGVGV